MESINEMNVRQAVQAFHNLLPGSIDVFRALSDEEVIAVKVVLSITEAPKRAPRSDRGQKRKAAEAK